MMHVVFFGSGMKSVRRGGS